MRRSGDVASTKNRQSPVAVGAVLGSGMRMPAARASKWSDVATSVSECFRRASRALALAATSHALPVAVVLGVAANLCAGSLVEVADQLRTGAYEEAITAAQAGGTAEPQEETWWRHEAEALLALGRYREAEVRLRSALESAPHSLRLRILLREAALHSGRPIRASFEVREVMRAINYANAIHGREYTRSSEFQAAVGEASLLAGLEPRLALENFLRPAQQARPPSRDAFLAAGRLAIDKRDYALAARTFRTGLDHFPDDPDLLFGLAASFRTGDRLQLVAYALQALEINPRHVPSLLLLADHFIDAERRDAANAHLDRALAVNPHAPEAHALRAALAHLQRDGLAATEHRTRALAAWPTNPRVDHLIGRKLSQNYLFAEGAEAQRRALALDSSFTPARVQLAQDLLRLGHEQEGWELAKQAHSEDAYNVEAYNLTTLQDRLESFTVLTSPHFRVRMAANEAPIYGERALALLERAYARMTERYGLTLAQPTIVEIYPDPKDFAVRTFGMPNIGGFLGVCFGPVFTINSPASARANWEAVLWHEFVHVITLTATRNRMPRWLSEGISVFEEQQADPRWGQQMNLEYHDRILSGRMQPISRMSAAFLEAKDNGDTQFAYFQSGLVVKFLVEERGFQPLRATLQSIAQGREPNAALEQHFGPLAELDQAFVTYARKAAHALAPAFDLRRPGDPVAQLLLKAAPVLAAHPNLHVKLEDVRSTIERGDWADARTQLRAITTTGLYLPGRDNVHALLARACAELGDTAGEREALTAIATHEADALDAVARLLALAQTAQEWPEVIRWSDAWLAINPLAATPWRSLLDAHEQRDEFASAAHAGRILLRLDPPDFAAVHFRVAQALANTEPEAARRHVLQALEEAPRFRAAYDLLATLPPTTTP
jgi:tetratricopeptide (TPR) repeat protein